MLVGFGMSQKYTPKREFLEQMGKVVPWAELVGLIEQRMPERATGRARIAIDSMQWCMPIGSGDGGGAAGRSVRSPMCAAGFWRGAHAGQEQVPAVPASAGAAWRGPEDFRNGKRSAAVEGLLRKSGMVIDAALIAAPSSSKNTTQIHTLLSLSNICMTRYKLMAGAA